MFLAVPNTGYSPSILYGFLGVSIAKPQILSDIAGLLNVTKQVMYGKSVDFFSEIQKLGFGGITSYSQTTYSRYVSGGETVHTSTWKIGLGAASPFSEKRAEIVVTKSEVPSGYENLSVSFYGNDGKSSALISENTYLDFVTNSYFQGYNTAFISQGLRFEESATYSGRDGYFDVANSISFMGVDSFASLPAIF